MNLSPTFLFRTRLFLITACTIGAWLGVEWINWRRYRDEMFSYYSHRDDLLRLRFLTTKFFDERISSLRKIAQNSPDMVRTTIYSEIITMEHSRVESYDSITSMLANIETNNHKKVNSILAINFFKTP